MCLHSIGDYHNYIKYNRDPCDKMITFLTSHWKPDVEDEDYSLAISYGRGGSCLSHSHQTQYYFVYQSLTLWREITHNMFKLWCLAEQDLLDHNNSYRLRDTGQGLNRMQSAPRISGAMHDIVSKVQRKLGGWVGLSVVHLGDYDVPNALVFIDKYNQVGRILAPIVRAVESISVLSSTRPDVAKYFQETFGGADKLRMMILQDYFRHGFDGSGSDGGSCIDGRLTSSWNWCSLLEKKFYYPAFLLSGFQGFDGDFT